jgi:hypothetical protein
MNLPPIVRWATGIRWQWKVLIPIIGVLLLSLVAVAALLRSLQIPEVEWILMAGAACAMLLCFVLLSVLLVLVEQPLDLTDRQTGKDGEWRARRLRLFLKRRCKGQWAGWNIWFY